MEFHQANSLLDAAGEGVKIVPDTKTRKTKMKLQHRNWAGAWTLVDTLAALVAVVILLMMAGLLLPARRSEADRVHCMNNLGQIGKAFRLWADDNADRFPFQTSVTNGGTRELTSSGKAFVHFRALSNELGIPELLVCPTDVESRQRVAATNFAVGFSDDNVSYFVGLDAAVSRTNAFLAGDRDLEAEGRQVGRGLFNLTTNASIGWARRLHPHGGNILLADGSVHQVSRTGLVHVVQNQGLATNRLVIP